MAKERLAVHAEKLRESEEYIEYLTTLRRINARGNTNTEHYIKTWGSLLRRVHEKVELLIKECEQEKGQKHDLA